MLTRIMTASLTVILMLIGLQAVAQATFTDVERGHWAYDAVDYLESEGLVTGYPDGTFRGDSRLTRYEFAMVISRMYVQLQEMIAEGSENVPENKTDIEEMIALLRQEFEEEIDDLRALVVESLERVEEVEGTVADIDDRLGDVETNVTNMNSRFAPFGDVRVRFEGKYPDTGLQTQRPRFRLRWGFTSAITPELTFGARFASAADGEITSTNRTLDDAFGFDSIAIDRAYIQWKPAAYEGFSFLAGKFSPPWVNTPLVWDSDVTVEGLAQSYNNGNFNFHLAELVPTDEGFYLVAQAGADDLFVEGFDAYVTYHMMDENCWSHIMQDMKDKNLTNRFVFDRLDSPTDYRAIEGYATYTANMGNIPVTLTGNYLQNLEGTAEGAESGWQEAAWIQLAIMGKPANDGDWQLTGEWGRAQANSVLSWLSDSDRGSGDNEWWGATWTYQLMKKTTLGLTWLSLDRISKDSSTDIIHVDISTRF